MRSNEVLFWTLVAGILLVAAILLATLFIHIGVEYPVLNPPFGL
jgi:hypothetical protein